jgi:hypothetical protein
VSKCRRRPRILTGRVKRKAPAFSPGPLIFARKRSLLLPRAAAAARWLLTRARGGSGRFFILLRAPAEWAAVLEGNHPAGQRTGDAEPLRGRKRQAAAEHKRRCQQAGPQPFPIHRAILRRGSSGVKVRPSENIGDALSVKVAGGECTRTGGADFFNQTAASRLANLGLRSMHGVAGMHREWTENRTQLLRDGLRDT